MGKRVNFVRGFHPPFRQEALEAANDPWKKEQDDEVEDSNENWLQPNEDLFKAIPKPTSIDDWLAQYKEEGQDCLDFAETNPWICSDRRVKANHCKSVNFDKDARRLADRYPGGKIYLAQIVQQGDSQTDDIMPDSETLIRFARIYLNLPVENLGKFELKSDDNDDLYVDISHNVDNNEKDNAVGSKRRKLIRNGLQGTGRIPIKCRRHGSKLQVHCPSLLNHLAKLIPSDGLCFVTLTPLDLYEATPDLFVAGLASGNQGVALFSYARYDPCMGFSKEFWHKTWVKSTTKFDLETRKRLVLLRTCKLFVHETCHLLGLAHCIHYQCCMNGSGHLSEDFGQPIFLCPVCLRKLSMLSNVNYERRYQDLRTFFGEFGMMEEENWLNKRLDTCLIQK